MPRDSETLMISVEADQFPAGTRLLESDPAVKANPRLWVPFAAGHRAIFQRRRELEQQAEVKQEQNREALRAERIRQGARPDPSDDVMATAAKKAVTENGDLELVHDPVTGQVTGVRSKVAPKQLVQSALTGRYREE